MFRLKEFIKRITELFSLKTLRALTAFKNCIRKIFLGDESKLDLYNYRWTVITSIVTFLSLVLGWKQLKPLFAEARIELVPSIGSEGVAFDSTSSSPFVFRLASRNSGKYNSSNWYAVLGFCKKTTILNQADPAWLLYDNFYQYHSTVPILKEEILLGDTVGLIGSFKISLNEAGLRALGKEPIPIVLFATYGERVEQVLRLIYLDPSSPSKTPFIIKTIDQKNEMRARKVLSDCIDF